MIFQNIVKKDNYLPVHNTPTMTGKSRVREKTVHFDKTFLRYSGFPIHIEKA